MATRSISTLLTVVEDELGLPRSPSFYGANADTTGVQLASLANRCIDEIRSMYDWSVCQKEFNIDILPATTVTGQTASQDNKITGITPNTSGIVANIYAAAGPNLPQAARVVSVDSSTQVTLNMHVTATVVVSGTYTFSQDTFALPNDFAWYNNQTMWDRTNFWKLLGPDSAQRDQWLRSGITPLTPRRHWRQLGSIPQMWRIWPPPKEIATQLQLVFEYLSTNLVFVSGGTVTANLFANDADTCMLDENSIITGVKWMFWEIKGFGSYVTMQQRWVDYVSRVAARDAGAPILNMAQRETALLISPANVQDGNFPAPPAQS